MRSRWIVVVALMLAAPACAGGDEAIPKSSGATGTEVSGDEGVATGTAVQNATARTAWDGPVRIGELPDWEDPFLAVAVGPADEPVIVANDVVDRSVRYFRCVDPGCAEPPIETSLAIPEDLWLFELDIIIDSDGDAIIAMGGGDLLDTAADPWVSYVLACDGADCATWEQQRIAGERHLVVEKMPDGGWLTVSNRISLPSEGAPEIEGENHVVVRTCDDPLCRTEVTSVDIPVPIYHRRPSVMLDGDGNPVVVLAAGAGDDVALGSGTVTHIRCGDPTCAAHEVREIAMPHQAYEFMAAAGRVPVVMYEAGDVGFMAMVLDDVDPYTTTIDPVAVDDAILAAVLSPGWGESPIGVYLRMMGIETPDETRDIVVAECSDPLCWQGTVTPVVTQGEDSFLNTNPAAALDGQGWPVIVYHDCEAGCRPMFVNVLRCEGGCATAFPSRVEASWFFPREG